MASGTLRGDWRRVLRLTSIEEAVKKLLEIVEIRPRIEEVDVTESLHRILAENVVADRDLPPYDCACFDGYAIKSKDTLGASKSNPAKLKVVGKVLPGEKGAPKVGEGETVLLATGSPMPPGADAIIKVEEVRLEQDYILVFREVKELENVAVKGEDVKAGDLLLKAGHIIRPIDVGLLLGLGFSKVKVYAKPRFAILSIGRGLYLKSVEGVGPPPNNYAYVIKGLIEELGGVAKVLGVVPDDVDAVKKALLRALKEHDVVITMGSCSIGVNDVVPDAINGLGSPGVVVHGLSVSPGKPAGFGVLEGKPIIMLPAHIVSAVAAFYVLCLPLLAAMTGRGGDKMLPYVYAKLEGSEEAWGAYRFLRARIEERDGEFIARSLHGGANVMSTLFKANYFTIVPPKTVIKRGDKLRFFALSLLDSVRQ